jgi:hypothetical protein
MEQSASLHDYVHNPIGRYLGGPTYLVWHQNESLSGMVFWGSPRPEHVAVVARAIDIEPRGGRRSSLVDCRHVTSILPEAYGALADYVRSRHEPFRHRLAAQALVRPEGMIGATVAGFYQTIAHPHATKVFADPHAALAWLGAPDPSSVLSEVDRLTNAFAGCPALLGTLQDYLMENSGKSTLAYLLDLFSANCSKPNPRSGGSRMLRGYRSPSASCVTPTTV